MLSCAFSYSLLLQSAKQRGSETFGTLPRRVPVLPLEQTSQSPAKCRLVRFCCLVDERLKSLSALRVALLHSAGSTSATCGRTSTAARTLLCGGSSCRQRRLRIRVASQEGGLCMCLLPRVQDSIWFAVPVQAVVERRRGQGPRDANSFLLPRTHAELPALLARWKAGASGSHPVTVVTAIISSRGMFLVRVRAVLHVGPGPGKSLPCHWKSASLQIM